MKIDYIFDSELLGTEEETNMIPQEGSGVMVGDKLYKVRAAIRQVSKGVKPGEFKATAILVELVEFN